MLKILNFLIDNLLLFLFFAVIVLAMLRKPGANAPSNLDDELAPMINPATGNMVLPGSDVDVKGHPVLK